MANRGWLAVGLVVAVITFVFVAGTTIEAEWVGCQRTGDSLQTQRGTASMHLAVRSVGCTYENSYLGPAGTEHHFPIEGVVLVILPVLLVLAGVGFVLGVKAHVRARMRSMTTEYAERTADANAAP